MTTTVAAKNLMLDAVTPTKVDLHSADPTAAGTGGVITGATASATYSAASAGSRDLSAALAIPITLPDANPITVSHYSVWAGATLLFYGALTSAAETYSNSGTANIATAPISIT